MVINHSQIISSLKKINNCCLLSLNNINIHDNDIIIEIDYQINTFIGDDLVLFEEIVTIIKLNIESMVESENEKKDNKNLKRKKNMNDLFKVNNNCFKDEDLTIAISFIVFFSLRKSKFSDYAINLENFNLTESDKNFYLPLIELVWSICNEIIKLLKILDLCNLKTQLVTEEYIFNFIAILIKRLESVMYKDLQILKIKKSNFLDKKSLKYINIVVVNLGLFETITRYMNIMHLPPIMFRKKDIIVHSSYFIFNSIFLIKQNKKKLNTVVTDQFIGTLSYLSSIKHHIDYEMLDVAKYYVLEDELHINSIKSDIITKLNKYSLKNFDYYRYFTTGEDYSLICNDISNTIDNEKSIFNKKKNDFFSTISDEKLKNGLVNFINNKIEKINKKKKNNLNSIDNSTNLKDFFKENFFLFSNKKIINEKNIDDILNNEIFNFKYYLFKWEYKYEYLTHKSKLQKLKDLKSQFNSIISKTVYINYFKEVYNYLIKNNVKYFYFLTFSDFRGRVYYKSNISVQNSWMYRFLYHFGDVNGDKIKNLVNIMDFKINDDVLDEFRLYDINLICLNVLKALGMINKKKLLNNSGMGNFNDSIKMGLEIFIDFNTNKNILNEFDISDKIVISYYCNIINKVNSGEGIKEWYIILDTNASINQHMGRLCGFKEDTLKYLNLDNSGEFCDTYQYMVSILKNYDKCEDELKEILNRKMLKKLIMTIGYSIGKDSALIDFKNMVSELNIENCKKKILLKKFYFLYYYFSSGTIENNLYCISKKKFISEFFKKSDNGNFILKNDFLDVFDLKMNNYYYNTKNKDIKIRGKKNLINISYSYNDYTIVDFEKTKISLVVNLIHAFDATYLRLIVNESEKFSYNISTIHDGFAFTFFNSDILIHIANNSFYFQSNLDYPTNKFLIKKISTSILS